MVLAAGALMFVLTAGPEQENHYRVHFAKTGDRCGDKGIHLDRDTGKQLQCRPAASGMPFTEVERNKLIALAAELAADGRFVDTEKAQVERLANSIAAVHGFPNGSTTEPGMLSVVGLLMAIALTTIGLGMLVTAIRLQ